MVCADIDAERVDRLRKGEVPILEDGLPALIAEGLASKRLSFVVGAPPWPRGGRRSCSSACRRRRAIDGAADLSFVEQRRRARSRPCSTPKAIVVNKSTVPVGLDAVRAARARRGRHAA